MRTPLPVTVEWARVDSQRIVVASRSGAWVHRPHADGLPDPFAETMEGRGTMETTRWLLDGAIGAAAFGRSVRRATPPLTPIRWLWRLAGYYRTTEATSRLLPLAARRFRAAGRRALEDWARRGTREELGHEQLALRDIRALGYDPAHVVARFRSPAVGAVVEYFTHAVVHADDPIGCVGYAYALERLAAEKDLAEVAAVQAILPPGVNATRCLRVHSAAGSDVGHVAETVAMAAQLSAPERAAIAKACYETARLFYAPHPAGPTTERELDDLLAASGPVAADGDTHSIREEDQWQKLPRRGPVRRPRAERPPRGSQAI